MLTFQQSREHCKRLEPTADSFSIPDRQTNDFIVSIAGNKPVWTNGCRIRGRWVWGDGSSIDYTNWNSGEPNNARGREHFLETRGGGWNDLIGSHKLCTVCQYHLGADYVGGGGGGGVTRPSKSMFKKRVNQGLHFENF